MPPSRVESVSSQRQKNTAFSVSRKKGARRLCRAWGRAPWRTRGKGPLSTARAAPRPSAVQSSTAGARCSTLQRKANQDRGETQPAPAWGRGRGGAGLSASLNPLPQPTSLEAEPPGLRFLPRVCSSPFFSPKVLTFLLREAGSERGQGRQGSDTT